MSDVYNESLNYLNSLADKNNAWSAQQAQKQMDFQLFTSNTAHQREVADLRAAGLNPILSAGGHGAQAMSGSSAQADNSLLPAVVNILGKAVEANSAAAASGLANARSNAIKNLMDESELKDRVDLNWNKANYKGLITNAIVRFAEGLTGKSADDAAYSFGKKVYDFNHLYTSAKAGDYDDIYDYQNKYSFTPLVDLGIAIGESLVASKGYEAAKHAYKHDGKNIKSDVLKSFMELLFGGGASASF